MNSFIKGIIVIVTFVSFSSCSIVGNYYITNESDSDVFVTLQFKFLPQDSSITYQVRKASFTGQKIKYRDYKKMDEMNLKFDDQKTHVHFVIAPKTYFWIGSGMNTKIHHLDHIKMENSQGEEIIDPNAYEEGRIKRSGMGTYTVAFGI